MRHSLERAGRSGFFSCGSRSVARALGNIGVAGVLAVAACGTDSGERSNEPGAGRGSLPDVAGGEAGAVGAAVSGAGGAPARSDAGAGGAAGAAGAADAYQGTKTILIVVEGLRRDALSPERTPNLWRLRNEGVYYSRFQTVFPSNSLTVAASLLTGTGPARHGLYGERVQIRQAFEGTDAALRPIEAVAPLQLRDYKVLSSLDEALKAGDEPPDGLLPPTLVEAAQSAGARTVVGGRSGPASLFDFHRRGTLVDDDIVTPLSVARKSVDLVLRLPQHTAVLFPSLVNAPTVDTRPESAALHLVDAPIRSSDEFVNLPGRADPTIAIQSSLATPQISGVENVLGAALKFRSDLTVIWLREPALTALRFGPSSRSALNLLEDADRYVGDVAAREGQGVNLVVVSSQGVTAVAGETRFFGRFPVRASLPVTDAAGRTTQSANVVETGATLDTGVALDGEVRLADLLTRAGFHAYDGEGCLPGLAVQSYVDEVPGCKRARVGGVPTSGEFFVPGAIPDPLVGEPAEQPELPEDAVLIASNGGAESLYLPSKSEAVVRRLAAFLMGRPEIGALFVADRFGDIPGALPFSAAGLSHPRAALEPDLIVAYAWRGSASGEVAPLDAYTDIAPIVGYAKPSASLIGLRDCLDPANACRDNLQCILAYPQMLTRACAFCPKEGSQPGQPATCYVDRLGTTVSVAELAMGERLPKGEFCELDSECGPGLVCALSLCVEDASAVRARELPNEAELRSRALAGTSYASMRNLRGVTGGFSPQEMESVFIAVGPSFKRETQIDVPASVLDVAPTLARALGLPAFTEPDGRVLDEALVAGASAEPDVTIEERDAAKASGLKLFDPRDPDSLTLIAEDAEYRARVRVAVVRVDGKTYRYPLAAWAERTQLPPVITPVLRSE